MGKKKEGCVYIYFDDLLDMLYIAISDAMEHFNNPILKEMDNTEFRLERLAERLKEEKPKIYRYIMNRPFVFEARCGKK